MHKLHYYLSFLLLLASWRIVQSQTCNIKPEEHCFDATCATKIESSAFTGLPCACTREDYGEQFTPCNKETNTRDLIYFYKPPATCLNGTLPSPIRGIPCNTICPAGTILNTESLECSPCGPGSYSYGAGHRWDSWQTMPPQFSTHCAVTLPWSAVCESWRLNGDTIDSGNNYGRDGIYSILELRLRMARNGSVSFEYKVSAEEGYDGLRYVVDDLEVEFISNANWTVYNASLSEGYHTIQWQYFKDRSLTKGEDKVSLRYIHVEGTTFATTKCTNCPKGYYSNAAVNPICLPCEAGKVSDEEGTVKCKDCPSGFYSFPGSTTCIPSRPCSDAEDSIDYSYYVTPCVNGNATKIYEWIYPLDCDLTAEQKLPPPETISCVPITSCKPGQSVDASGQKCNYCPAGSASLGNGPCETCHAGSAASSRVQYINSWNRTLSTGFSSGCSGESCFIQRWRSAFWFTDSGLGHGKDASPWLDYTFKAIIGSTVSMNYSLECMTGNQLLLSVNNDVVKEFQCTGQCSPSVSQIFNLTLPRSEEDPTDLTAVKSYSVRWTYVKRNEAVNTSCDRFVLYDLTIDGVIGDEGGSAQCLDCIPGTHASNNSMTQCQLCSPGTTSGLGAIECDKCEGNTFADVYGAPSCTPCGNGTLTSADRTRCEFNCQKLTFLSMVNSVTSTRTYDLSSLKPFNLTFVDTTVNGTAPYKFVGSVCSWSPDCTHLTTKQPLNAYICLLNGTTSNVNLGKVPAVTELIPLGTGLLFHFSEGEKHLDKLGSDHTCSTQLEVKCDPSGQNNKVQVKEESTFSETFAEGCELHLVWRTPHGCPLCTEDDYTMVTGSCVDGKEERSWVSTNPYCFGGASVPEPEYVDCKPEVSLYKTTVVLLVLLVLAVVGGAVVALIILIRKNRKLYSDYAQLRNNIPLDEPHEFNSE